MSLTTKVLLYDTPTLLDMTEKEFISAVHNKDPAYVLLWVYLFSFQLYTANSFVVYVILGFACFVLFEFSE